MRRTMRSAISSASPGHWRRNVVLVRAARERQERLGREVPAARRGAARRCGARRARRRRARGRTAPARVAASRVPRQSRRARLPPRSRRSSSTASAAQSVAVTSAPLDAATSDGRPSPQPSSTTRRSATGGQRGRECVRRGPELGPVGKELVVGERVLVDQILGCVGPQQGERDPADVHGLFPELGQRSASRPTVRPGGSAGSRSSASSTPAVKASREVVS